MIPIVYREGDCFNVFEYEEFSVLGCITPQELTITGCQPVDDGDDATDLFVEHHPHNITIVTYSNSDGECRNWIGPTDKFVVDPNDGVAVYVQPIGVDKSS